MLTSMDAFHLVTQVDKSYSIFLDIQITNTEQCVDLCHQALTMVTKAVNSFLTNFLIKFYLKIDI